MDKKKTPPLYGESLCQESIQISNGPFQELASRWCNGGYIYVCDM